MNPKVNALKTLLRTKRITIDAIKEAIDKGIITKEQYKEIVGEVY